jgi:hypothetical protein
MEFLSPKTKEHIERLERENTELKEQIEAVDTSQSKKTSSVWIVFAVAFAALSAYLYFFNSGISDDDLAAIQVELWTEDGREEAILSPNDQLQFSVQVGSFKDMDFSELSKRFVEASTIEKDSLTALVVGNYQSLPQAQEMLAVLVSLGMENAYIVAHKDGKNVGLLSNKTTNN